MRYPWRLVIPDTLLAIDMFFHQWSNRVGWYLRISVKSLQRFTLVRYLRVGVYSGGVVKLYGKMG